MSTPPFPRPVALAFAVAFALLTGRAIAIAGVPEPDTVFFGSIALDGRFVSATNTDVVVELRASTNGPALRSYRMGANPTAGNLYLVRAVAESAPPLLQPDAVALGSTVYLAVRDAGGVRELRAHVLSERGRFVQINFGDVDSDGDGMSDSFELSHFGSNTGADPTADPDQDGRPNLREFLQDTNPLLADGRHPADLDPADDAISIGEVTAYTLAWQLGENWPVEPLVIPVEYVTRAGALWKGGERYDFDNTPPTHAPLWWVNTPSPSSPSLATSPASTTTAGNEAKLQRSAAPAAVTPDASSPVTPAPEPIAAATRFVAASYLVGQPVPVRIRIEPEAGTLSFALEETPPLGWLVRNISHGGRLDRVHHKIKWGPFYDLEPRDLTYETTALTATLTPVSFAGTSSFNGRNLALAGLSTLVPAEAGKAPSIVEVAGTRDGGFRFDLRGTPSARYLIESSTDLLHWEALQTVSAGPTGTVHYEVPQLGLRQRFFRARTEN